MHKGKQLYQHVGQWKDQYRLHMYAFMVDFFFSPKQTLIDSPVANFLWIVDGKDDKVVFARTEANTVWRSADEARIPSVVRELTLTRRHKPGHNKQAHYK